MRFSCLVILVLFISQIAPSQTLPLNRPHRPARNATAGSSSDGGTTPLLLITTTQIWGAVQSKKYSFTLAAANDIPPRTWSVSAGALPPGMTLDPTSGQISGVPTTAGVFSFTATVSDISFQTATAAFKLIVSSSDNNFGNVGDPYATEGGAPDPSATVLNSCPGTTALTANGSYRLGQNLMAATPGTTCITLISGAKVDLAGFTISGRIFLNGNPNGIRVFNGTINCTWADSGSNSGCLSIASGSAVTAPVQLHHLSITNTGIQSRSIHLDWPLPSKYNGTSLKIYNITANVLSQPTVSRSFALSLIGANQTPEFFNNDLTCAADAAACQGIMCFGTDECKFYHNHINLMQNTTAQDARGLLFDSGIPKGEAWNNTIIANNNRAIRLRNAFNIRIHDNTILNIAPNSAAAIHLADPSDTVTNDLNVEIDNNDFELAGGAVIFIRNGINAVARKNRFTCNGTCNLSKFAQVRSPLSASAQTQLSIENNPNVILFMAPAQNAVEVNATLNACNSGQSSGAGIINVTACPP